MAIKRQSSASTHSFDKTIQLPLWVSIKVFNSKATNCLSEPNIKFMKCLVIAMHEMQEKIDASNSILLDNFE